jgi:hypothetical protein
MRKTRGGTIPFIELDVFDAPFNPLLLIVLLAKLVTVLMFRTLKQFRVARRAGTYDASIVTPATRNTTASRADLGRPEEEARNG